MFGELHKASMLEIVNQLDCFGNIIVINTYNVCFILQLKTNEFHWDECNMTFNI